MWRATSGTGRHVISPVRATSECGPDISSPKLLTGGLTAQRRAEPNEHRVLKTGSESQLEAGVVRKEEPIK